MLFYVIPHQLRDDEMFTVIILHHIQGQDFYTLNPELYTWPASQSSEVQKYPLSCPTTNSQLILETHRAIYGCVKRAVRHRGACSIPQIFQDLVLTQLASLSGNQSPPPQYLKEEASKTALIRHEKQRSYSTSREQDRDKSYRTRSQSVPSSQLNPVESRPHQHHHHHHHHRQGKDHDRSKKTLYSATAIYSFAGTSSGDLSLHVGDVLEITKEVNADWLKGTNRVTHQSGTFPRRYVKVDTEDKPVYKTENIIRPVPPPPEAPKSLAPVGPPPYVQQTQAMTPYQPTYRPTMIPAPAPAPMPAQMYQPPQRGGFARNIAGNLGNAFVFGAGAAAGMSPQKDLCPIRFNRV